MQLRLTINDQRHELDVEPHRPLAEVIRTDAALTGTKVACGEGTCGSCTVLVDGRAVLSCLTLAVACDGADVRTVEGDDELLGRLQAAFTAEDAFQCGFCTPGQLLSAVALLRANPHPTSAEIRAGMSGNLCRCGAYPAIERAVTKTAGAG
ncbi:MAG TPA: (2Fe-2S)-binding protein [Gaiellales bacterium]|jgi:aerobic-type carbon monoxide dehydrogenase small subunit (CoxS/CutS family)